MLGLPSFMTLLLEGLKALLQDSLTRIQLCRLWSCSTGAF